ncbi:MAG: hypothetical protein ACI8PW_000040 [Methylophilaceae bacterium]|jgi:hypothetical protein
MRFAKAFASSSPNVAATFRLIFLQYIAPLVSTPNQMQCLNLLYGQPYESAVDQCCTLVLRYKQYQLPFSTPSLVA